MANRYYKKANKSDVIPNFIDASNLLAVSKWSSRVYKVINAVRH